MDIEHAGHHSALFRPRLRPPTEFYVYRAKRDLAKTGTRVHPSLSLQELRAYREGFCASIGREILRDGSLLKIGETPEFGTPLPARLQRLVQSERDFLLKGFQSENKGFGIGAFAYYRRLVEDLKNKLIDEIIKTCRKIPTAVSFIPTLEKARDEKQFSRAIEEIGDAIPDALRIDGHNPLSLLHQALSRDLHSAGDEDCLQAANAIRVVLTELSERMTQITRGNSELKTALGRLFGNPPTT